MAFKDPRTANADKSIWLSLKEDTFREHLVSLEERTNAVPIDPEVFDIAQWHQSSENSVHTRYTLPIKVEQQLSDDFARLVAVKEGAQSVAAVCLEEHFNPPKLTLRFAALDVSLSDDVQTILHHLSRILAKAASDFSKGARTSFVDELFQHIIQLHFLRLVARLRSTKWVKPKYLSKSHKKPLWQDFTNLLHRAQFLYTKREKPSRVLVESSVNELALVYQQFEKVAPDDDLPSLMRLVDASFRFCTAGEVKDFASRLENSVRSAATPQVGSAIKCLRQIEKIAAYRRMSISLFDTAKAYPQLFQNGLGIEYLKPYKSIPTTIRYESWATSCHVHAEIQLAVHYDLASHSGSEQQNFMRPRCIGISKWLCFLCCRFLQAHGSFFPSKTHGRLYDQWTVPDLEEFGPKLVSRYREILRQVDDGVMKQTENEPELWRIEPRTSVELSFSI